MRKCQEDLHRELRVEIPPPDEADLVEDETVHESEWLGDVDEEGNSSESPKKVSTKPVTVKPIAATRLFSVNRDVEAINQQQLDLLGIDGQVCYQCKDNGVEPFLSQLKAGLKVSENIKLCIGAQVCNKNSYNELL